jgi:hypothetical protein
MHSDDLQEVKAAAHPLETAPAARLMATAAAGRWQ